ncbi:MAG: GNAT family protein [bacterium]
MQFDVELRGGRMAITPLKLEHIADLQAAWSPDCWKHAPDAGIYGSDVRVYVEMAIEQRERGKRWPHALIALDSGRAVGTSSFYAHEPDNGVLSIGYTWLWRELRGTGANRECKLLMLRHAFEVLGLQQIRFKAAAENELSRRALEGIGARFDGVSVGDRLYRDGRVGDNNRFSIAAADWPVVRSRLEGEAE